jgi:hypothetical protein
LPKLQIVRNILWTCEHIPIIGRLAYEMILLIGDRHIADYCYICKKSYKEMIEEQFSRMEKDDWKFE